MAFCRQVFSFATWLLKDFNSSKTTLHPGQVKNSMAMWDRRMCPSRNLPFWYVRLQWGHLLCRRFKQAESWRNQCWNSWKNLEQRGQGKAEILYFLASQASGGICRGDVFISSSRREVRQVSKSSQVQDGVYSCGVK